MRSFLVLLLLGASLITVAIVVRSGIFARKNPGRPINATMRQAMPTPQFSREDAAIIAVKYGRARENPSGLYYMVRKLGKGPNPPKGSLVTVNYEGRFLDETVFDSSAKRGGPYQFQVGVGREIKGWDEAVLTMRKGERRTLIIPHWLAYGESGKDDVIPPKTTLVYEMELVDFAESGGEKLPLEK